MAYVVSLADVRPAPRFDDVIWQTVTIEEAPDIDGPWTQIEDQVLDPLDSDPEHPLSRDFTVTTASSAASYFRVRFEDINSDVSYTDPIGISTYPSTEELISLTTVTELTDLTGDQQDVLRDAAIATIEEFCGQSFDLQHKTVTIDGQGANVLFLPERLQETEYVAINGYAVTLSALTLNDRRDRMHFSSAFGLNYYEQALAEISGERFPLGFGNVVITGDWGWVDFPDAVRSAILWDMEDTARADANVLSASVAAFRKLGLRSIDQGNLRADISGVTGLSPRVMNVLAPYVWHGSLGALV